MNRLIKKYRYETMFLVTMLAYLILYIPVINEVTDWCITPYALSYRLGFISRGFIGTIIRLIVPNLTIKHIYIIILISILLLCGLTLFFMHKIIKKSIGEDEGTMAFLLGLFLVNPGSIAFLFYWGNYGRFDMFLLMILLISALLVMYDKCVWIIPFLCVCAVLIHQGFVFQYFPAILILLFYTGFIQNRKYGKSIFVVTLLGTCAMFLYMQFFSSINYTYEETLAIIDATTDLPASFLSEDLMIKIEYYTGVMDSVIPLVIEPFGRNVVKSITTIVFLIPMIKIIADIWKAFVKSQKNIIGKLFPWFILVAEIPMFIITCDYGRDYSAIILCNFILIFTLYVLKDQGIIEGIRQLTIKIKNNLPYYVFVIVIAATIDKFNSADVSVIGHRMYSLLESIFF